MTTPRGVPPECANPIDAAVLADYWLALLPSAEEEAIDLHLLECDHCGNRLREVMVLSEGLRALARSGSLRVVVSDELVRHAATVGRRVREYAFSPGDTVPCTVSADDDLLVAHLAADVAGASRIDLSLCDPKGVERQRMSDIPVRRDAGTVMYQESITFAKASPTTSMIARLLAVDADGAERLLGEYTFQHTRTIPGPPAWDPD
jgi:hypothetical protein